MLLRRARADREDDCDDETRDAKRRQGLTTAPAPKSGRRADGADRECADSREDRQLR
jgi:hypothetical protein